MLHRRKEQVSYYTNIVPRAFPLAWGRKSQGKGPGSEVDITPVPRLSHFYILTFLAHNSQNLKLDLSV